MRFLVADLLDAQVPYHACLDLRVGVKTSGFDANLGKSGSPISLFGGTAVCQWIGTTSTGSRTRTSIYLLPQPGCNDPPLHSFSPVIIPAHGSSRPLISDLW